jgi:aspartyl-tRNA(Asn)/glutamyl-tRNA(Gln) amidotransferase subunit C
MISRDDIKKLANLSRIKLSSAEEEKFTKEIDSILGYVAEIKKAAGSGEILGSERVKNVLRPDENPHETGVNTEALLAEAPERKDDYVKVKKIL